MKVGRELRREVARRKREIMPAIVKGPAARDRFPAALVRAIRKEKEHNAHLRRNSKRHDKRKRSIPA